MAEHGASREQLSQAFYNAQAAGDEAAANKLFGYMRIRGMSLAPMSPQQEQQLFQQRRAAEVAKEPALQRFWAGVGKSFMDTARGLGQVVGVETPEDIARAREMDQPLMNTTAGKLGDWAGQVAQIAGGGEIAGTALKGAEALGAASPYIESALASGAFSGAQPVTGNESRLANTAIGAGLGAAGEAIPRGFSNLSKRAMPIAKREGMALAKKLGIPVTLVQASDSPFLKTLGSAAQYLPLSGATKAGEAQQEAFNRALSHTIGQDSAHLTPDVIKAAEKAKGDAYDALFARNEVKMAPETVLQLNGILKDAGKDLTPDQAKIVRNQVMKYVDAAKKNKGVIPGRLYQNIRQSLQKVEGHNQPSRYLVGQVRKTMQDAAEKSFGPQDAAELQALNGVHSNLKIIKKGLGQISGADYSVAPARLWALTNGKYGATPEIKDLARMGQTVLKNPIGNSHTANRLLAYNLLAGGAAAGAGYEDPGSLKYTVPLLLGGATVGRALNSAAAGRVLPVFERYLLEGAAKATKPANKFLPLLTPALAPQ